MGMIQLLLILSVAASTAFVGNGLLHSYSPRPTPAVLAGTAAISATPASYPTLTSTPSPTATPTPKPSPTPQPSATPTPTLVPTPSPVPSPLVSYTSAQVSAMFDTYAVQYHVDPHILRHIAQCESGFNPAAKNGIYGGLYQFSASTWSSFRRMLGRDPDPDLRYDPAAAIETAAYMLSINRAYHWPNCLP